MRKIIAIAATLILSSGALSAQRLIVRMDDIGASHAENLAIIADMQSRLQRIGKVSFRKAKTLVIIWIEENRPRI